MTDSATPDTLVHLRAAGVSVVVDLTGGTLPRVLHWGSDLGDLDAAALRAARLGWRPVGHGFPVDGEVEIAVLPQESAGFLGTPGSWAAETGRTSQRGFVVRTHDVATTDDGTQRLTVRAADAAAGCALELRVAVTAPAWSASGRRSPTTTRRPGTPSTGWS